jgi:glycosyltransferase involved in cell wall biosynthesis
MLIEGSDNTHLGISQKVYYWIDHTPGYEVNSGIQRVTRGLARALEELGTEVVYLQWSTERQAPVAAPDGELRKLAALGGPPFRPRGAKQVPLHTDRGGRAALWGNWLVVPEVPYYSDRRDLTFELVDYARSSGLKIAFVFYDMIPITLPGYGAFRLAHERYVQLLTLADMVLPISRYSAQEFERYCQDGLKLPASEMPQTVPILLADEFATCSRAETVTEPSGSPIKILCLGMIEPRKNQLKLLEAFNAFCSENPGVSVELSLVGRFHAGVRSEFWNLARANPKIEVLSHLPDEAVIQLLRACHFSVFPSVEEGYGLPIAESLWLGKPCLCANFGSMAEVAAPGGCLTVDTRSVGEIKHGLTRLIVDGSLRQELRQEAITRRPRLWRDYATDFLAALQACQEKRRVFYGFDHIIDHRSRSHRTARTLRLALGRIVGVPTRIVLPEVSMSIDSVVRRVPAVRRRVRPCIAFLSPYPPDPAGAADYIAQLLPEVCRLAEVELFTDSPWPQCQGGVRFAGPVSAFARQRRRYDATVAVIGDSAFHKSIAELVRSFGGICITYDSSLAVLAGLLHRRNGFRRMAGEPLRERPFPAEATSPIAGSLNFDSLFFDDIVYAAQRVIVHTRELQARVKAQYGVGTDYLPLYPRLEFRDDELGEDNQRRARARLGIGGEQIVVAGLGAIKPERAPKQCLLALQQLHSSYANAHLYLVGVPSEYAKPLRDLARDLGIESFVHFMSGSVSREAYRDYLIASHAAVQIRADGAVTLSHALMDAISAGLPTVANASLAASLEAPSYVRRVPDGADPAAVAGNLAQLLAANLNRLETASERKGYQAERSLANYAEGLRDILGFV